MRPPCRHEEADVLLIIHAQPGARQTAFAGQHGDALKMRVAAVAEDGRANRELCRFLAEAFAVALSAVTVVSGESARAKRVRISSPRRWPAALEQWRLP
jgi:uncharacterized protein (TIGR00251 family)